MEQLTNIIEAILFASGKAVSFTDISEKLEVTVGEVKQALKALKSRYGAESGIHLLEFNGKAQLATNPAYREQVSAVLSPIRERELTRALLECAAIIAYKQPITRTEIELLRGVNSDYAVGELLKNNLIYPCGRKDAVGHPVMFATTDEFLKRFQLVSIDELPNYDELIEQMTRITQEDLYLYARRDETDAEDNGEGEGEGEGEGASGGDTQDWTPLQDGTNGYELPDFMSDIDDDDLVKIS